MKYKGQFFDKDDINSYQVTIDVEDGNSAELELLFSGVPFTTQLENSDDTIFKPVKYQSATIGLLAFEDDYKFNLYSSTAQQNKVTLTDDGGNVKWIGYVTPSLYNIGYEARYEDLDVDCIDGLSTLQYYKYEAIDDIKSSKSLLDLILHIIRKCNCYEYLYILKNVTLDNEDELYHRLYLNLSLFFEDDAEIEDGERVTDDDDTYKEALEKILTYLGVTLYAEGKDCYIVDFDCLKQRKSEYYKVTISDGTIQSDEQLYSYFVNLDSYQTNNQSLSLTKVYNKVTVKDEFRTIKNIFPDLYDIDDLEKFYPIDFFPSLLSDGTALWCNCANIGASGTNNGLYQFFNNKRINFYSYDENGNLKSMKDLMMDLRIYAGVLRNNVLTGTVGNGCCICKAHLYDADRYSVYPSVGTEDVLPYFTFDNYVLFTLGKDKSYNTISLSDLNDPYYVKMFETELELGLLVGTNQMYFVISGNFMYYDEPNIFGLVAEYKRNKDSWEKKNFWIPCSLKYQNLWWNGTEWQDSFCKFKLYCNSSVDDHYLGKNMDIVNGVPWIWNINKTGTAIKLPDNVIDSDSPQFAIYRPASPSDKYRIDLLWMKDFNIEVAVMNQDDELVEDTDTKYTNIINLDHTEELGEIKLDVCTYDNKTVADNCITYFDGTKFSNLDKVNHIALNSVLDGQLGRFEEYLCCKIANQYETPKIKLTITLKDDFPINTIVYESNLDKWFIIDGKEIDYRFKEFTYTLIEKE